SRAANHCTLQDMNFALRTMLLAFALIAASRPVYADLPRRHGFDLAADIGVDGSLCSSCNLEVGRAVGAAALYRPLPHLAVGLGGELRWLPVSGNAQFPSVTALSGFAGATVRGYFLGRGRADGFVGLTLGPCFYKQSPPAMGTSTSCIFTFDHEA